SPDGSRVFYSGQNTVVSYVDIATGTIGTVAGSASWSMQLGPDGNIYTSPTGTSVGIISSPNTTPTYSTMAIPGGGSIFRGLSNIGWLTPTVPNIYPDAACPAKGFTHDFKNYFLANIAESSVAWDFGDGNTGTGASPTHTYTSNGTFTVTMTVTDATCNQTFTNTASVTIGCTLPVEWTEVNAVQKENGIAVTWATSKEENNDYFVIQRSEDGLHFSNIGQLDGRGSSTSISSYEFIDMTPGDGENYYRIVQYDRNKDFSYSNVVSALPEGKISIQVSPNPSESSFDVHIIGGDKASYSVMDVLGRELTSNISAGSKNFSFGADLAEGVYFLRVNTGDQVLTQKLVKE
ncbi:MAG: PKD domain-containing protein, partial [Cytophagaceae bacterium]